MKASTKFTWGVLLNLGGGILFIVGLIISFSIIGACLGIPMAIIGAPLMVWGAVLLFKARADKTGEIIARGIREGLGDRLGDTEGRLITCPTARQALAPPPVSIPPSMPPPRAIPPPTTTPAVHKMATGTPRPGDGAAQEQVWQGPSPAAHAFTDGLRRTVETIVGFLRERRVAVLLAGFCAISLVAIALGLLVFRKSQELAQAESRAQISSASRPLSRETPHLQTPHVAPAQTPALRMVETPAPVVPSSPRAEASPARLLTALPPKSQVTESPGFTDPDGENKDRNYSSTDTSSRWQGEQFPETRWRLLSSPEAQRWSSERLQYAINEMFARRGADFGDKRIFAWFRQFSWYRPLSSSFDEIEKTMPQVEHDNLKLLGAIRDERRLTQPSVSPRQQERRHVTNPEFPPDPVGQMIARFFQSLSEPNPGPRRSPTPRPQRR